MTADGTYASVTVTQEAPAATRPCVRTGSASACTTSSATGWSAARLVEVTVCGARTELAELAGKPAADVLLLNDEDLTYAKTRLDGRLDGRRRRRTSATSKRRSRARSPGRRRGTWSATRSWPTRDYVTLVCNGLPLETDINLVTATLSQARSAITKYADPAWAATGWQMLCDDGAHRDGGGRARQRVPVGLGPDVHRLGAQRREAGHDQGLARRRLASRRARPSTPNCAGRSWRRWSRTAAAGEAEITAELDNDRTASGERQAAIATALIATPSRKGRDVAAASPRATRWRTGCSVPCSTGFQHSSQVELTKPYAAKYFERHRQHLGDPRQRAGPGVRRGRVPGAAGQRRHGPHDGRVARGPRPRHRCAVWSARGGTASSARWPPARRTRQPDKGTRTANGPGRSTAGAVRVAVLTRRPRGRRAVPGRRPCHRPGRRRRTRPPSTAPRASRSGPGSGGGPGRPVTISRTRWFGETAISVLHVGCRQSGRAASRRDRGRAGPGRRRRR